MESKNFKALEIKENKDGTYQRNIVTKIFLIYPKVIF